MRGRVAREYGGRLFVGKAFGDVDDRVFNLRFDNISVAVEGHKNTLGKPIFPFLQAADVVGQRLGQHGNDLARQVNAGAAMAGFIVNERIGSYVMRYVGDVHAKQPVSMLVLFEGYGVVKILGVFRVDGNNQFLP